MSEATIKQLVESGLKADGWEITNVGGGITRYMKAAYVGDWTIADADGGSDDAFIPESAEIVLFNDEIDYAQHFATIAEAIKAASDVDNEEIVEPQRCTILCVLEDGHSGPCSTDEPQLNCDHEDGLCRKSIGLDCDAK